MTRSATATAVTFRAGSDGVGHAVRRGETRYPCGLLVLEERHAWPVKTKCGICVAALELEAASSGT
jgi:hypothetical protein